ncbi:7154_t:CDS:2, partial [Racocetra persica]
LPKQTQYLRDIQMQQQVEIDSYNMNQNNIEDEIVNPLEVLTDCKTYQEQKETEAQIHAKLSLLETQVYVSSNLEVERSLVTINEDLQDSLSAEL